MSLSEKHYEEIAKARLTFSVTSGEKQRLDVSLLKRKGMHGEGAVEQSNERLMPWQGFAVKTNKLKNWGQRIKKKKTKQMFYIKKNKKEKFSHHTIYSSKILPPETDFCICVKL